MKKLSNPKDLVVAQLSELLWVERRLAFDVLPELIKAISDDELRGLVQEHHEETGHHVERVEAAFKELGMEPSSALSPGLSGMIEQHKTLTSKIVESGLADTWHASAAIGTEHFEIALYTALDVIAPDPVRETLAPNLKEEQAALEGLVRVLDGLGLA